MFIPLSTLEIILLVIFIILFVAGIISMFTTKRLVWIILVLTYIEGAIFCAVLSS